MGGPDDKQAPAQVATAHAGQAVEANVVDAQVGPGLLQLQTDPREAAFLLMQIAMELAHMHQARESVSGRAGRVDASRLTDDDLAAVRAEIQGRVQTLRSTFQSIDHEGATALSTAQEQSGKQTRAPVPDVGTQGDEHERPHTREPGRADAHDQSRTPTTQTPEFRVQRSSLIVSTSRTNREWSFQIDVPMPTGQPRMIAQGSVMIDEQGQPLGGPEFYFSKETTLDGVAGKFQVYDGETKVSVTDLALDQAIKHYRTEFGHDPTSLPGSLAFENRRNFQREYAIARTHGNGVEESKQIAVAKTSFGRARSARGYGDFNVKTSGETSVDFGEPLGVQTVPEAIDVDARKSQP